MATSPSVDGRNPRGNQGRETRRAGKVGAVIGGALGALLRAELSMIAPEADRRGRVAWGVTALAAAGAVSGYMTAAPIGMGFPADDWRRVPYRPRTPAPPPRHCTPTAHAAPAMGTPLASSARARPRLVPSSDQVAPRHVVPNRSAAVV